MLTDRRMDQDPTTNLFEVAACASWTGGSLAGVCRSRSWSTSEAWAKGDRNRLTTESRVDGLSPPQ